MNNAAYWVPVEEELARRRDVRAPFVATMEYGGGIVRGDDVQVVVADAQRGFDLWLVDGGTVPGAARVTTTATGTAGPRTPHAGPLRR